MANSRSSVHPIHSDFSSVLQNNFEQLNSLPLFNIDFIDKHDDWYLLCFLKEQQRNGHSFEVTLSALNSIVGTLSEDSGFVNPINNSVGYLNQNHHIIGESASNKTSICNEIGLALHTVNELFPGRYSSSYQYSDDQINIDVTDNLNQSRKKTKSNENEYSMVLSNVTEVGLVMNLSKINTLLLHGDGDVALQKLGYYEQGKNETAAGISLFCDASDGIRCGFVRGTGVNSIKINRPVALMSTYIASTGTKMAPMLHRLHETPYQDGVFGRMFYTWCESITDLPKAKSTSYTNVASFSHFSYAVACFFKHSFQFRYSAHQNDFNDINEERKRLLRAEFFLLEKINEKQREKHFYLDSLCAYLGLDYEERLIIELEKQGVATPITYSVVLNNTKVGSGDVVGNGNVNVTEQNDSSFKLLKTLLADWWKSSNSNERHFKSIRRKVITMLSKCIWSMKIVRIIFQLMSKILKTIDQKQGDRVISTCTAIDLAFQQAIQASIKTYLSDNCHQTENNKLIMWSNKTDVIIGYNWYLRKMLVTETFLSLKTLPDIIENRLGRKTIEKNQQDIKLEKAMSKVMNFSVVFFTRQYMTNNSKGAGSGQFSHSYDLKPDQILSSLVENGLLIGGNFIKYARPGNDSLKYASFCKQLPSVIQNNPRMKRAFEVNIACIAEDNLYISSLKKASSHTEFSANTSEMQDLGLNMIDYEITFEHQRLPLNMEFTNEAVEFMRVNDEFVQYYHNYYEDDSHLQPFRGMVDERIRLGQIVKIQDKMRSSSQVSTNSSQNEHIHGSLNQLNNTSSEISIVKANSVATTTNNIQMNNEITSSSPTKSSSNHQTRTTTDEVVDNYLHMNNIDVNDRIIHDQSISSSTNSNGNTDLFLQSSQPNDHSRPSCHNDLDNSSYKDLTTINTSINDRQSGQSNCDASLFKTTSFSIDDLLDQHSVRSPAPVTSEHILNDQDKAASIDSSKSDAEQSSPNGATISIDNSLVDITNNIESHPAHSDNGDYHQKKKRGRPNSNNSTSQKLSIEDVNNLLVNPQSFASIWKSILIKRKFLLGTLTDLFKMIPCKLFDEKSRFKVIDLLLQKKLLIKADWFCDSKGNSIKGYLKGSPADPDVAMALADFGIDIEEYKDSLRSEHDGKRLLDGKMMNQSYLFSNHLQQHIENDHWFSENVHIDERFVYIEKQLLQTISNYQTDEFQKQQKEKVIKKLTNKRKRAEELQKETTLICGTDIGAKRKRKPKIRDD